MLWWVWPAVEVHCGYLGSGWYRLKGPLLLIFFFFSTILKWMDYAFLVCFCFEMLLLHLFAELVTCHSFLTSWTCIGAVKVNLISLHIKNKIAIQPPLPSILEVYLHTVLMHIVFLISSFGANMTPFCLFPTVGAWCVLGRISVLQQQQF